MCFNILRSLSTFELLKNKQDGLTALFMACEVGDVPTVEVLLEFGPDLNIREKVSLL